MELRPSLDLIEASYNVDKIGQTGFVLIFDKLELLVWRRKEAV